MWQSDALTTWASAAWICWVSIPTRINLSSSGYVGILRKEETNVYTNQKASMLYVMLSLFSNNTPIILPYLPGIKAKGLVLIK